MMSEKALVLLSGGQDSATCLAWALSKFSHVETVGFDYSQRHRAELKIRVDLLSMLRIAFPEWDSKLHDDHLLHLPTLGTISETALTRERAIEMKPSGLPNTFVPGRNLLFLTLAAALAYERNISHLVIGVCETDYSGYPDCRRNTIEAIQLAINLGMEAQITIHTPLMRLTKAETWQLAFCLGGSKLVDLVRMDTLTCYLGEVDSLNPWGRGCGKCPACLLRLRGWEEWKSKLESPVSR